MRKLPIATSALLIILLLVSCNSSPKKFENDAYQVSIEGYSDGTCDVTIDGLEIISRKMTAGTLTAQDDDIYLNCQLIGSDSSGRALAYLEGEFHIDEKIVSTEVGYIYDIAAGLKGTVISGRYKPLNHITPLFMLLSMDLYDIKLIFDRNVEPSLKVVGLGRRLDRP